MGFAIGKQAHHNGLPNRVYLYYGLIVHLPLLPTPPCGDAVTFGYGTPEHPDKDFHLADSMPLPAHSPFAPRKGVFITAILRAVKLCSRVFCHTARPTINQNLLTRYGLGSICGDAPPIISATSLPVAGAIDRPSML